MSRTMTPSYYAMNAPGGGAAFAHHSPSHHRQDPSFSQPFHGHHHARPPSMAVPPQGSYHSNFMPHHGAPAMYHRGVRPMGVGMSSAGPPVSPSHSPSFRESMHQPPSPHYEQRKPQHHPHHHHHHQAHQHAQSFPRNMPPSMQGHQMQHYPAGNVAAPMPPRHMMSKYEGGLPSHVGSNPASPPHYNRPGVMMRRQEEQDELVVMKSEDEKVDCAIPESRPEHDKSVPSHLEDAASILLSLKTTIREDDSVKTRDQDLIENDAHSSSSISSIDMEIVSTRTQNEESVSFPSRLSMPDDHTELNKLHCFIRDELLEVVVSPKGKNRSSSPSCVADQSSCSSKDDLFSGKVGFRCVHCAHAERRNRNGRHSPTKQQYDPHCTRMSTFYPESVTDLYRLVCLWQSCHFRKCRNIPPAVRETYQSIKQGKKTLGKTRYWVSSAEKLGLVDIPKTKEGKGGGGICFAL